MTPSVDKMPTRKWDEHMITPILKVVYSFQGVSALTRIFAWTYGGKHNKACLLFRKFLEEGEDSHTYKYIAMQVAIHGVVMALTDPCIIFVE